MLLSFSSLADVLCVLLPAFVVATGSVVLSFLTFWVQDEMQDTATVVRIKTVVLMIANLNLRI